MRTAVRWAPFAGIALVAMIVVGLGARSGEAATAPDLGTAGSFAVLAGSAVTNTGPSVIDGDLGVSPGTAISGFPPGLQSSGATYSADAVATLAQNDVTTAYNVLAGADCDAAVSADLAGLTLDPGVYCFSSSGQLNGMVTLDAGGDPAAVFIFQFGTTLITGSGSSVSLIGGAQPCNVFWQVGSSATLGTTTAFRGNILALASITLNTSATLEGRALARNGAVTLDSNVVTAADCALASSATAVPTATTGSESATLTPTESAGPGSATPTTPAEAATSTPTSTQPAAATSTSGVATATIGPDSVATVTTTSTPVDFPAEASSTVTPAGSSGTAQPPRAPVESPGSGAPAAPGGSFLPPAAGDGNLLATRAAGPSTLVGFALAVPSTVIALGWVLLFLKREKAG